MTRDIKLMGHVILCLLTPWLASSLIYFASQSQWWSVLGVVLSTGSICMLGLEGIMSASFRSRALSTHDSITPSEAPSVSESVHK